MTDQRDGTRKTRQDQVRSTVTVADIAARLGVSSMTVSRVVNGLPGVGAKTRLDVAREIKRAGYVPNRVARGLRQKSLGAIALVVPEMRNPFFTEIVHKLEEEATAASLTTLLGNSHEDIKREAAYIRTLVQLQVDGVVVSPIGDASAAAIRELTRHHIPVVLVDRSVPRVRADLVVGESFEPARRLTAHLIEHGHLGTTAMISGPASASTSRERYQGYLRALADAGIEPSPALVREGAFSRDSGYEHGTELLNQPERPTAIFAVNSFVAFGVIDAARILGLSVPHDLAVVCFDDFEVGPYEPFLTCADQPVHDIGSAAASLLLSRLAGDTSRSKRIVFPSDIRLRASCGCPPGAELSAVATL